MNKYFTKGKLLMLGSLLVTTITNAQQIDLQGPANQLMTQVKAVVTPVMVIAYIIYAIIQVFKHFMSENGDTKKGAINIVGGAVLVGIIYGLIRFVASLSL